MSRGTKIIRVLLWGSLSGGGIAVFLLMLLAGMMRQYGLAGMGESGWDEAAGAVSLCLCAGASVLTLLRLRGLRSMRWMPRMLKTCCYSYSTLSQCNNSMYISPVGWTL